MEALLARFDPQQFSFAALVFLVLAGVFLFIWRQVWPWWVKEAWPTRQRMSQLRWELEAKQEEGRTSALRDIRDVLVEFRALGSQNLLHLQSIENSTERITGDINSIFNYLHIHRTSSTHSDIGSEIIKPIGDKS